MPSLDFTSTEPQSGKQPKQLVILLHGYGSNKEDLISLAPYFSENLPDAKFISPDAPYPCEMGGFGKQWFSLNPYTVEHMFEGALESAPILDAFIDEQLEEHGLDSSNLALIGFSQGTMMSLHVSLRRANNIAGVVGYSGALLDDGRLQEQLKAKPMIHLIHGTADPVVPFEAMSKASKLLGSLGVKHETHERPMLMHSIDPEGIEIAQNALKTFFSGTK